MEDSMILLILTGTYTEGMPDEFYKYFHKIADSHVQTLNHMDLSGKVVMENQ